MAATRRDWLVRLGIVGAASVVMAVTAYVDGAKTPVPTGPLYLRGEHGALLSIEKRTYWRLAEARENRDQRPMHAAMDAGDAFFVETGAELAVLKRESPIAWVEVVSGPAHGRRGWLAEERVLH